MMKQTFSLNRTMLEVNSSRLCSNQRVEYSRRGLFENGFLTALSIIYHHLQPHDTTCNRRVKRNRTRFRKIFLGGQKKARSRKVGTGQGLGRLISGRYSL